MYAVIRTGGKQYRVSPGDLLVVEKLSGEPGDELRFDTVLMAGDGGDITVGAPAIDGAVVSATLIETRKGEKIKVFKKIRRQGYRRTRGHRQTESVLRVTGVDLGGGKAHSWDGKVDLTPRSELQARARGLAVRSDATTGAVTPEGASADVVVTDRDGPPVIEATVVEHYAADTELTNVVAEEAPAKPKRPRKAAAPAETSDEGALVEQPISETVEGEPQSVAAQEAAPAPKKTRAKKAPAADAANEGE